MAYRYLLDYRVASVKITPATAREHDVTAVLPSDAGTLANMSWIAEMKKGVEKLAERILRNAKA